MPTALECAHKQLVQEVADSYSRQGFKVQVEPSSNDLPEAFRKLHSPDLIVTTPAEHLFVEVKWRGRGRDAAYWKEVQDTVKAQPGWRFEFIVDNQREQELIDANQPLFSNQEIETHLRAGQQLAEQGIEGGGLLITWAALEAVLWRISQQNQVDITDSTPAALLSTLVSEGSLDREDYRALMQILPTRNQAAHGHYPENLDRSLVEQTQAIAYRLLAEQHQAT